MWPSRGGRGGKPLHDGHHRDRGGFPGSPRTVGPGRDFTMVLLAGGITGVGVWFALITSFIVEFDPSQVRKKRWRARMLERLDGHVILCGG